ncbi:hypothetical protein ALC57_18861, partial [Trachymyrmex cornetzi]
IECYRNAIAKRRSRSTWAEVNLEYYSRISRVVLRIEEFSFLGWKVVRRIKDPSLPRPGSPGSYACVRLRITVTARQYQNTGTRLTIPSLHRYPTQNTLASDSHSEALYLYADTKSMLRGDATFILINLVKITELNIKIYIKHKKVRY